MYEIKGIIPAVDGINNYRKFLTTAYDCCVLMNIHISLLDSVFTAAVKNQKNILLHIDRINGLSDDEYGAEYICQKYRPTGAISIKPSLIGVFKKNSITAIQRIFLIDSFALAKSAESVKRSCPDYVEFLPGVCPELYGKLKEELGENIIAGGLIPSQAYAEAILKQLKAVTISFNKLK